MIKYLRGKLVVSQPTGVVLDFGGVGVGVIVPLSSSVKMPELGAEVTLHTYLHVREDVLSLYGFVTQEEKKMFLLLLGVSKIGPKVALGILSGIPVDEFKSALLTGNIQRLSMVSGVGKKTAERLILELKEKIPAGEIIAGGTLDEKHKVMISDTIMALVSLGYNQMKAQKAVEAVIKQNKIESLRIEELVKLSLQKVK